MTLNLDAALDRARENLRPKTKEEIETARVRQLEEAFIVARALDNPAGKAYLELLWRKFGAPVEFDPALGFETGAAIGYYRSGQSALMNWTGSMIERARAGGPPASRERTAQPQSAVTERQDGTKGHRKAGRRSRQARSKK